MDKISINLKAFIDIELNQKKVTKLLAKFIHMKDTQKRKIQISHLESTKN